MGGSAGNSLRQLDKPCDVTRAGSFVFIADRQNRRVLRVDERFARWERISRVQVAGTDGDNLLARILTSDGVAITKGAHLLCYCVYL